jgi:hypothetical protein
MHLNKRIIIEENITYGSAIFFNIRSIVNHAHNTLRQSARVNKQKSNH